MDGKPFCAFILSPLGDLMYIHSPLQGTTLTGETILQEVDTMEVDELLADYELPVEVCPGVFWVGRRTKDELLHCNSYLLEIERDRGTLYILIDPGSPMDFRVSAGKLVQVMGSLERLSLITINHQDPDIILTLPVLLNRFSPNALVLMTENTWRLVSHTGIPKNRMRMVEQFQSGLRFKGAKRELKLVPTPFCHFTGAFAIYDISNRILFTGDLFGGVTLNPNMLGLYATDTEQNWQGIKMFHELYMPCNSALRYAVEQITRLEPPVEIIAPQHGSIIKGRLVREFLNRMKRLYVGADLLTDQVDRTTWNAWNRVANEILEEAKQIFGTDVAITRLTENEDLLDMINFDNERLVIEKFPKQVVESMLLCLTEKEVPQIANMLKIKAILSCEFHGLPAPAIDMSYGTDTTCEDLLPPLADGDPKG